MHRTSIVALSLLLVAFFGFRHASEVSGQTAPGFTMLLSGTNLDGWDKIGDANWRVVDGTVQSDKGMGFLVSKGTYGDFQLRAEFWVTDDANSGIFIRCTDRKMITADNAYEVNIFDKRPDPAYRTGAIVNVAKPAAMINAGGRWNTYDIVAKGSQFTITLNGMKTVDVQDNKHARGCIALQAGAGTVRFKNVQIKTL
jgi:hypothetical protein